MRSMRFGYAAAKMWISRHQLRSRLRSKAAFIARWAGLPALVYFGFFCLYTWPWIAHFNDRFFTDTGDGFQNVWNMWWVNKSVTQLHQLPWHTTYLHAPYGTTLLGQTLNPFNGFAAIPLLRVMSLMQAFNTMVIFSFTVGGVTAFWLCYFYSRRYVASLIGGFVFTFSSYHFAHAIGHMQLVSLEWIPLFVLLFWRLCTKPTIRDAIGAAGALFLVLLCDYYYFFYSVVAATLIVIYLWRKHDLPPLRERTTVRAFSLFVVLVLATCAPLPLALLHLNTHDTLLGSHNPRVFSTDLFTPFVDGGFWRFASLTHSYWRHIGTGLSESSVYLGISVIALLVIALFRRSAIHRDALFWVGLCIMFGVLSLGPRLMVRGKSYGHVPLPYAVVEHLIPPLRLSGTPIRMMVMVTLGAAVVVSMVLGRLDLARPGSRLALIGFAAVLVIEMWPGHLPNNPAVVPEYVSALRALPSTGAVLDVAAAQPSWPLYDQTIHGKPIAFGYVSRLPSSVARQDAAVEAAVRGGRFSVLCDRFRIRYYVTPFGKPMRGDERFPVVYNDGRTLIYDLETAGRC